MTSVEVERELRERILRQDLRPGMQLREQRLAEEFGATRGAVRSALIALESRSLVERIPNKGAIVARLDPDRILAIYDVFELLEGLAARLAALNSTSEDWASLDELFGEDLHEAIRQGDYEAYYRAIEVYRETVTRIAGNEYLTNALSGIYDQTNTIIRRVLIVPGRCEESYAEHRQVIDALLRGDAEAAEHLKRQNMVSARRALEKYRNFLF